MVQIVFGDDKLIYKIYVKHRTAVNIFLLHLKNMEEIKVIHICVVNLTTCADNLINKY